MIDIEDDRAKQRIRTELVKIMVRLEYSFIKKLRSVLNNQYKEVANVVTSGETDINFIIDRYRKKLIELFETQYKRTVTIFSKKVFQEVEEKIKSPLDEFWAEIAGWVRFEAASKVVRINKTTKKILRNIILRGMYNGLSHLEIAEKIKKTSSISTLARARTIARTETHGAATRSINTAMKATRLMKEKEWISALDERTRREPFDHLFANGERIPFDDYYQRTGERLKYPGDSSGSAGNIINCRCSELFFTKAKVEVT